ncbi:hypothetical protein MYA98_20795 [Salmonella sp. WGH-01]|nr:hypothetical protein MYA98_20795 [Salmonella sp. WGH-01]
MKTDGTGAISNISPAIGDAGKNNIKLGDTYTQAIADWTEIPSLMRSKA